MMTVKRGRYRISLSACALVIALIFLVSVSAQPPSRRSLQDSPDDAYADDAYIVVPVKDDEEPAYGQEIKQVPSSKTEREEKIRELISPAMAEKIRDGEAQRVRRPTAILPDIEKIMEHAQAKKDAASAEKKEVEIAKKELKYYSDGQLARLPPGMGKQITSLPNIFFAELYSDLSRIGAALRLGSNNVPILHNVRPDPLDPDQCTAQGCSFQLSVSNTFPPFTGDRTIPLTFVLVSVEEPINPWQYGWSRDYHLISIQAPSPGIITFTLPRTLDRVNRLRVRLVNYVDGNMYISNREIVDIFGVPPEPTLNQAAFDPSQNKILLMGGRFFPGEGISPPGQPHSLVMAGDKQGGVFVNGYSVPFVYQSQQLLVVDPANLVMGGNPIYFLVANKLGQRFTISEVHRYHPGGGTGTPEICDNGIDDDRDGLIDCADPDCTQHPACSTPQISGLVGKYSFDEGSGTIVQDGSEYGNDGTISGASWQAVNQCKFASCLSFDGVDDYVEVPDSPSLNPLQQLTIAAWIKPGSGGTNDGVVIAKGNLGNQYHLRVFGSKIRFVINGGIGPADIPYNFASGVWHHVAGTYDGSTMKIYVNGNPIGAPFSMSAPIAGTQGAGLYIGRRPAVNHFRGSIDEVHIYDQALTASQIGTLAGQGLPGEICDNGIDDEGDMMIDCLDPECDGQQGLGGICQFGSELACDDFFDNDADTLTDCQDSDCFFNNVCQTAGGTPEICDNGIDDDGDSFVDCMDILDCCADASCAQTQACTISAGEHVATIEMGAPLVSQFTLQAAIPVPPGAYTRTQALSGQSPFGVIDSTGVTVPAQTTGISRAPNGDYDVVEIMARVNRDPAAQPGTRITYPVVITPHQTAAWPGSVTVSGAIANGPSSIPQDVKDLVQQPLLVRARDVFGNVYTADITQQRYGQPAVFRHGPEAVQIRTYNTMTSTAPQGPPNGALPHLMGVHAYFTARAQEPVLQIDFRISNAASGLQPNTAENSPQRELYFKEFELLVPNTYMVDHLFDQPSIGTPYTEGAFIVYPIVSPEPGGKMRMMSERSFFSRRLTIAKQNNAIRAKSIVEHEGLGFVIPGQSTTPGFGELWSWHNPQTGNYFPQKIYLPTLNHIPNGLNGMRAHLTSAYNGLKNSLNSGAGCPATGNCFFINGALGQWSPSFIQYGGGTSGSYIYLTAGQEYVMSASHEGFLKMIIEHAGSNDRQSNFLYRGDGEPLRYEDVIRNAPNGQPIVPWRFFGDTDAGYSCPGSGIPGSRCDPFGYRNAPTFHNTSVHAMNAHPAWETAYIGYDEHDAQHLIRNTYPQMALAWMNDALAKDDVKMQAELAHAHTATLPMGFSGSSPIYNSGSLPSAGTNGKGSFFGRGQWHPTQVFVAAYALSNDDGWRSTKKATWFDYAVTQVLERSQIPCTGILGISKSKATDNNYWASRGNEMGMGSNALRATLNSVYRGSDPAIGQRLQQVMNRHYSSHIIDINNPNNPYSWSPSFTATRNTIIVAAANQLQNTYCTWASVPAQGKYYATSGTYGGPATFEPQYSFSYAKSDTGNVIYDLALFQTVDSVSGSTLLQRMQNKVKNAGDVENPGGNSAIFALACAQRGICRYP